MTPILFVLYSYFIIDCPATFEEGKYTAAELILLYASLGKTEDHRASGLRECDSAEEDPDHQ